MQIRPPTPDEALAFFGKPYSVRDPMGAFVNDKLVALCGLARDPQFDGSMFEEQGPWIGFLEIKPDTPPLGLKAIWAMVDYLRRTGETIYVQCDTNYPKAERLMQVLGLKPTGRSTVDPRNPSHRLRIWVWQPLPPS